MKLDRALEIAGRARIRRRVPSSDPAAAAASSNEATASSERPILLRDPKGRFAEGNSGGPGRPPRDALREAYISDLYAVWKQHGRAVIRQLAEEHPVVYFRIVADIVRKMRQPGGL